VKNLQEEVQSLKAIAAIVNSKVRFVGA